MSFIAADWSIDRQTKNIRYIWDDHTGTAPSYATGIEFHRALQDFADDAWYTGNDELDITDPTPSDRSFDKLITLINGWNIDDTAAEHIYDTTLFQDSGNTRWDGIQVVAPLGTQIQIIQNGAVLVDDFWNQDGGINNNAANGISHQFLLKTRTAGADIDGRRFVATSRTLGTLFVEFKVNWTGEWVTVVPLPAATDLNNQTSAWTLAGYTTITNLSEWYNWIDVDNNGANEFYYSKWDKDAYSINQFYERMKWLTRDGSASTLYGLNGELFRGITHEITVDGGSGTWSAFEAVSWSGGTGQLLARNNATATSCTKLWVQLLTGVAPIDNQTITWGTSSATNVVNVTVTERTVSTPFCWASTGSALIWAYGFSLEATDLSANDKVFDLTNTLVTPPNYVTFTVSGLVAWDTVLVTNDDASDIDYNQFVLNGALTGAAVTSVVITGSIPADTPSTGTIRILRADGQYTRHSYTSWAWSTFTIGSTNFSTNNAANGANTFISYIDWTASGSTMTFTSVFVSTRTLYVRVRNASALIKTFQTTASLTSSGGSTTAIRTSDA